MIYLASPYSDPDPAVRADRVERAALWTAGAWIKGYPVFSPIVHSESLVKTGLVAHMDHDFWLSRDIAIMLRATQLWVLTLPGWQDSFGVAEEIDTWLKHYPSIPIEYWPENVIPSPKGLFNV